MNSKRSSIIGFALIGIILLLFSWYNTNQFEKQRVEYQRQQDSIALANPVIDTIPAAAGDSSAVADTLGTLCVCTGLFIIRGFCLTSVKLIVIILAMWITGPVCTNRIAAAELASSDEYKKHLKEEGSCR